jgi:O-antigen ligase
LKVTAALLGIWAIWEYATGQPILLSFVSDVRRAVGPVGNPNYFGILLAVLAVAAFGSARKHKSLHRSFLSLLPGILATVGVLATLSRGAVIAEALALGYLWTRGLTPTKRGWIVVGLLAMMAVTGPIVFSQLGASRRYVGGPAVSVVSTSQYAESLRGRLGAARLGLDYVFEHPWTGIGLDRFPTLAQDDPRLGIYINTHNEPLRIAAESGVPALAILVAFSWRVVSRIRKRVTWVAPCVLACCICYLMGSLSSNGLESTVVTFPLVALITLAVGWGGAPNGQERIPL